MRRASVGGIGERHSRTQAITERAGVRCDKAVDHSARLGKRGFEIPLAILYGVRQFQEGIVEIFRLALDGDDEALVFGFNASPFRPYARPEAGRAETG